jgi:uncharacterized membrane protein
VGTTQIVFGVLIVVVLAALGGYYGWRQFQTLRRLRAGAVPPGERRFVRNQAFRRLAGSFLMLLFAALFVGMFFLEGAAAELVRFGEEARARNERPEMDPAQKEFFNTYTLYWVVVLLVLLAIIALAGYELFAIRRFSVRSLRQLQAERRAMLAEEAARLRGQRNGQPPGEPSG